MTRDAALAAAERYFDEGGFVADLGRRVAIPTESQVAERALVLRAYLADEIVAGVPVSARRPRPRLTWTPAPAS